LADGIQPARKLKEYAKYDFNKVTDMKDILLNAEDGPSNATCACEIRRERFGLNETANKAMYSAREE
jgi:hypothetical protein